MAVSWKLVNNTTNEEVQVGDFVKTMRGLTGAIISMTPPPTIASGSTGKVCVRFQGEGDREFFPAVVDCKFVADGLPTFKLVDSTGGEIAVGTRLRYDDGREGELLAKTPPNKVFLHGLLHVSVDGEETYQGKPRTHSLVPYELGFHYEEA